MTDTSKNIIAAAAIKWEGKIYLGRRHCDIIHYMYKKGIKTYKMPQSAQGFVDVEGVWHTRTEAAKKAFRCGQIKKKKPVVFSEDLW